MKNHRYPALKRAALAAAAGALLALGGCGRGLPAIDPELLASKKSILVLTGGSLSDDEIKILQTTAAAKAKEQRLALEFIGKTSSITPELSSKINSVPYDGIIAVGNELIPEMAETAKRMPNKRFVLLGTGLTQPALNGDMPANVLVKKLDESKKLAIWDEWVRLQKASGLNVLWISKTSAPIPAAWAPSEETDRLLNMDIYTGDTWFPQLTYQAHSLPAHWLAVYSPVEEAALTRIRSLKIPVMDLSASLAAAYHWEAVLADSISGAVGNEWSGGVKPYTDQEVTVSQK